jgi:hypothetical protein
MLETMQRIISSKGKGSGYRALIQRQKFKCLTCGKTFEVVEETLFSRNDDEDNGFNAGYITLSNIDGNCPNSTLMAHTMSTYIPISRGKYNNGLKPEIRTFENKESWLHHLKNYFKAGFYIEFRYDKIGREELKKEDLKGLAHDDMSDESIFLDKNFEKLQRYSATRGILLPSLIIGPYILIDLTRGRQLSFRIRDYGLQFLMEDQDIMRKIVRAI